MNNDVFNDGFRSGTESAIHFRSTSNPIIKKWQIVRVTLPLYFMTRFGRFS